MRSLHTIPILKSRDDGEIYDLETVESQEIPIKVYVMFYNTLLD